VKARLLLTAQTPLSMRAGREREQAGTLSYIPGTVLLGALAFAHTVLRPGQHDEFAEFFLRGNVWFGNLYPANFEHPDLADDTQPVYPVPHTAYTCKRFPGFLFGADQERDPRHGVWDHLIPWALFVLSGGEYTDLLDANKQCRYPGCNEGVDRADGFYRRGLGASQIGKAEIRKGIRTRTGISRLTGVAAEGILYSREVLHEDSRFWGTLTVATPDLEKTLQNFVEEAAWEGLLRLGNNRTRGFGRAIISQFRFYQEEIANDLAERARAFNTKLQTAAKTAGIIVPHPFYLPITLVSDAILYDQLLRYQLQLTGDYLNRVWGIPGAELIYQNAGRRQVTGWNELWGLPKADEWAISMGSVFLFGLLAEPDFEVLARAQREGMGARRREGFGQVRVADPFHQEVSPL